MYRRLYADPSLGINLYKIYDLMFKNVCIIEMINCMFVVMTSHNVMNVFQMCVVTTSHVLMEDIRIRTTALVVGALKVGEVRTAARSHPLKMVNILF